MASTCVKCSTENKTNQHRLIPLLTPITYECAEVITDFRLPRKYTNTHNDETGEIYISVGHQYNQILLDSEEARVVQSQVVGKWVKVDCEYQIHFTVLVSTEQNPNAYIRNFIFCEELGVVLEGFAFAETALLRLHPKLARAKIFVHFKSIDPAYDRVEYWHRLGYWAADKCCSKKSRCDSKPAKYNFRSFKTAQ